MKSSSNHIVQKWIDPQLMVRTGRQKKIKSKFDSAKMTLPSLEGYFIILWLEPSNLIQIVRENCITWRELP